MRRFVVAMAGVAAMSVAANAADMPVKAPPMAPPPSYFSWTGFYVGGNAGYAWGRSNVNSTLGLPCTACYIPSVVTDINNVDGSVRVNSSGFTGGLQLGYNIQASNIVFGVEADFDAFHLRGTTTTSAAFTGFPVPAGGTPPTYTDSIATNWLITVRGRLGMLVSNNLLVYATGGLAVTDLKYSHTFVEGVFPGTSSGTENSSVTTTKFGYAVGGGLEYALNNHWSVKGEYLFLGFGSVNTTGIVNIPPGTANGNTWSHSANLWASVARLGVNYKF